jgi:hypothetical protein
LRFENTRMVEMVLPLTEATAVMKRFHRPSHGDSPGLRCRSVCVDRRRRIAGPHAGVGASDRGRSASTDNTPDTLWTVIWTLLNSPRRAQ